MLRFLTIWSLKKRDQAELKQVGIVMILPGIDASLELINQIAIDNNDRAMIGRQLRFPDASDSVMRGRTLRFNPFSALDRYVITGCDDRSWSASKRSFYPRVLEKGGEAPGWPALSAIQETPEHRPVNLLVPMDDSYAFFDINSPQTTPLAMPQAK